MNPCSPETIQLIEVPPPPRASLLSVPCSTESSSYCWSSSSSTSYSPASEGADLDEDEDGKGCESYCSSDEDDSDDDGDDNNEGNVVFDDNRFPLKSQSSKMSRVLAWRNSFDSVDGSDAEMLQSLKQKYGYITRDEGDQCDRILRCGLKMSIASSLHICSACDASFSTMQQLQHHANEEACRVAVQYGFES